MEKYTCCHVECQKEADWLIEFSKDPMDFSCACEEHLAELISSQTTECVLRKIYLSDIIYL